MDYIQTGKDNFMHTYAQLDVCFDKGGDAGFMTQTERNTSTSLEALPSMPSDMAMRSSLPQPKRS